MAASAGNEAGTPPRLIDIARHLDDLRTRSYEGRTERADRDDVFRRAVELMGPVVTGILDRTNQVFLAGTGEVRTRRPESDGDGGLIAGWELSWPEQRAASNRRGGGPVAPVQVVAWFAASFTHGHLAGSRAGHWPLQVTSPADAERQATVVGAIVEADLHERIMEAGWPVVPAYAGAHRAG
jgi:hypothetical protein